MNELTIVAELKFDVVWSSFLEAALWADCEEEDINEGLTIEDDIDFDDKIKTAVKGFVDELSKWDKELVYSGNGESGVSSQVGYDLYMTVVGHGVGFWDGDWEHGDELTELAEKYISYIEMYKGDDGVYYLETN